MNLPWIGEESLTSAIDVLVERIESSINNAPARTEKNIIDPFSSILIAASMQVSTTAQLQSFQTGSSILTALSMALGSFHQTILGSVDGWHNHDAGYDLENRDKCILAEVKNKHNTLNAANREKVVDGLNIALQQKGRGWEGYLVTIIPRKKSRYKDQIAKRPVYDIDGASFYTLATGYETALHDLFLTLLDRLPATLKWTQSDEVISYCKDLWRW